MGVAGFHGNRRRKRLECFMRYILEFLLFLSIIVLRIIQTTVATADHQVWVAVGGLCYAIIPGLVLVYTSQR